MDVYIRQHVRKVPFAMDVSEKTAIAMGEQIGEDQVVIEYNNKEYTLEDVKNFRHLDRSGSDNSDADSGSIFESSDRELPGFNTDNTE